VLGKQSLATEGGASGGLPVAYRGFAAREERRMGRETKEVDPDLKIGESRPFLSDGTFMGRAGGTCKVPTRRAAT
jgi:hypothetical protein